MQPEVDAIIQAISAVGFPIVASVGMFYLYNKTVTTLTETLTTMNVILQDIKQHIDKLEDNDNAIHAND
jgi:hypothetical protein